MFEKWLEPIAKCALFEGIDSEQMLNILRCLNLKVYDYRKNEIITMDGEEFNQIGVVLSGSVLLTKETAAGNRVIISRLCPGEIFGEMAAYSGEKSWPITVMAQTACSAMFFPREKIVGCCENVCVSHLTLIKNLLKVLSQRALMLNKKVEYLSLKSLRSKISAYLLEEYKKTGNPLFQLNLNRNDLADFINVSRPSLSRELSKMREEGLIDFYNSAIKIINFEALKELTS